MSITSVLLVRQTALGDVVLLEPAIRALRERFPGARIDLVTEQRFVELARALLAVDAVVGFDRHGRDRGLAGIARVVSRLPVERYDVAVDLAGKPRTRLLLARVPASRRLVIAKRTLAGGLLALLGTDPPIHDRHASALYLETLAPLGILAPTGDALAPRLARLEPLPREGARASTRIGLAPGASHATKRWPSARFAELAERLCRLRPEAELVLIGGEGDRSLLEEIAARAHVARFAPLDVAALDPLGLARVIAGLELLVSVDSGPAHLAAGLGVPVVVLFGPTSPVRWGPRGPRGRVVTLALDCSPCSNFGGERCPVPARAHACMEALDVAMVEAELLPLLGSLRRCDTGAT